MKTVGGLVLSRADDSDALCLSALGLTLVCTFWCCPRGQMFIFTFWFCRWLNLIYLSTPVLAAYFCDHVT